MTTPFNITATHCDKCGDYDMCLELNNGEFVCPTCFEAIRKAIDEVKQLFNKQ